MAKKVHPASSTPHSDAPCEVGALHLFAPVVLPSRRPRPPTPDEIMLRIYEKENAELKQAASRAMAKALDRTTGRLAAALDEAEALVGQLRELKQAAAEQETPAAAPAGPPAIVNFNGPIITWCDRDHPEDVIEDDDRYIDRSKKEPNN